MKYLIIGYTSNINIENNSSEIRYLNIRTLSNDDIYIEWANDIYNATKFDTRKEADSVILNLGLKLAISYGVKL